MLAVAALLGTGAPVQAKDLKILSAHLPPYSMKGEDKQGFVAEVAQEIAERVGNPTKLHYASWSRVYKTIQNKPNRLLAPIARTPQREDKLSWVVPVFPDRMVLLTYGDDAEKLSLQEAAKQGIVGVQQDSLMHELAKKRGIKSKNLDVSGDLTSIARKFAAGRIDAWLSLESLAVFSMKEQGLDTDPMKVGETISEFTVYIGGSPGLSDKVKQRWRDAFEAMKKDGTYEEIMAKYGA
ncbi:substrate-binding periplasmic protein [Limimonas halophila]|uniref:substrate-binding periplasmic protein n=1 Tax=Limimonas halophila TaxID=1082479 RepID=UPI0015A2CD04|nr:transporter substrate-binding domain-containing protein [Limimonas halophila]